MKKINCPACGARMTLETYEIDGWHAWPECGCGLRGPLCSAATHRGAAIKAGRAMRRIMDAVEVRIARADNAAFAHGLRVGGRDEARAVLKMLQNRKLTRRQITERAALKEAEDENN